jgi:hypothetical protein
LWAKLLPAETAAGFVGERRQIRILEGDSVFAAQQHYAACLRDGTIYETEGADYLKTVRAMFACYESALARRLEKTTC